MDTEGDDNGKIVALLRGIFMIIQPQADCRCCYTAEWLSGTLSVNGSLQVLKHLTR